MGPGVALARQPDFGEARGGAPFVTRILAPYLLYAA
jgi:hypothetical protein